MVGLGRSLELLNSLVELDQRHQRSASPVSQKNPDRIPSIKTLHEPDGGGGDGRRQREDELAGGASGHGRR